MYEPPRSTPPARPPLSSDVTPVTPDLASAPANPLELLRAWLQHAIDNGAREPAFVTLATASREGAPSSRTVQIIDIDADALLFTTSFRSRKGVEMRQTGRAAVSMHWREIARAVDVTGVVAEASDEESDRRFAEFPRFIQASRIASDQGRVLDDERARLAAFRELVTGSAPLARPQHWKWFRVVPDGVTFWQERPEGLNFRLRYSREAGHWRRIRIQS